MKKFVTAFVATAMLATVPLAVSSYEAEAKSKYWKQGLAAGVGAGIGLGIVNSLTRPRQQVIVQQPAPVYVQPAPVYVQPAPVYVQPAPVYQGGFSQAHYQYCFSRYRSYHAQSNSFQPYHGPRRPCYSGR